MRREAPAVTGCTTGRGPAKETDWEEPRLLRSLAFPASRVRTVARLGADARGPTTGDGALFNAHLGLRVQIVVLGIPSLLYDHK